MNFLLLNRLRTPHIPLGVGVEDGLAILSQYGDVQESNEKEHCFRVDSSQFSFAIYEDDGIVKSVWYDDPTGRDWRIGKRKKVRLYLARYGNLPEWEERIDNGWMKYYFNDSSESQMVYGLHNDVIRFNKLNNA